MPAAFWWKQRIQRWLKETARSLAIIAALLALFFGGLWIWISYWDGAMGPPPPAPGAAKLRIAAPLFAPMRMKLDADEALELGPAEVQLKFLVPGKHRLVVSTPNTAERTVDFEIGSTWETHLFTAERSCFIAIDSKQLYGRPNANKPAELDNNPWGEFPKVLERWSADGLTSNGRKAVFSVDELPEAVESSSGALPVVYQYDCAHEGLTDLEVTRDVLHIRPWHPWPRQGSRPAP